MEWVLKIKFNEVILAEESKDVNFPSSQVFWRIFNNTNKTEGKSILSFKNFKSEIATRNQIRKGEINFLEEEDTWTTRDPS